MTLNVKTPRTGPLSGDGSTVAFAYNFLVDTDSEIVVIVVNDTTNVETVKTLTTDYTVSGTGSESGGTVTFVTAPASGESVWMRRSTAQDQGLDLENRGAVVPQLAEDTWDETVKMIQDIQEQTDRAVIAKLSANLTGLELPDASSDRVIGWNTAATALENKTVSSSGYVTLPGSATDNAVPRFDGTSGASFQASGVTIDDDDDMDNVRDITTDRHIYVGDTLYLGGTTALNGIDDIEYGTFTPELADAQSGGNEATFVDNVGIYQKLGALVHGYIVLQEIDTTGLTGGNDLWITGMPFAGATSLLGGRSIGSVWMTNVAFSGYVVALGPAGGNASEIQLWDVTTGATAAQLTVSALTSGSARIIFKFAYSTSA